MDKARGERATLQKELGALMKAKADATALLARKEAMDTAITEMEVKLDELAAARDKALDAVPNELDPTVPVSKDEKDNIIVAMHGTCRASEPSLLHHHELLAMIDGYESERGVAVAGHRAYFLKGVGVLLNQALINYGLAFLSAHGYTPLQPPFFMNKEVMAGVAQLEDFAEQLYKVVGEDEKYLIATSEQPICVFHKGDWLYEKDVPKKCGGRGRERAGAADARVRARRRIHAAPRLRAAPLGNPRRYAGYSSCFRKEAGAHGRDAWGIFRVHQFEKVEQFVVCSPDESAARHDEMITVAQDFYKSLGFAYRTVNIVSGELNNAATKKYDLEAWFPTLGVYRELVSASNCTDYQARAMETRYGGVGKKGEAKRYCHFLNATLCATERTICAVLENYQVRRTA